MDARKLNHRITFQQKVTAADSWGQSTEAWENVASIGTAGTIWANALFKTGKEFISAGAEINQSLVSFRIRKRTGITAAMRIVYAGAHYSITAVIPSGDNQWLDIACTQGANQG